MFLVISLLTCLSITNAEPLDPIYHGDPAPISRRHGLDSSYFQQPNQPSFTSEVESAIRAHTAAYQATRARDLAQLRFTTPEFPLFDPATKVYDSTKGSDDITSNVQVFSNRPGHVKDTTVVGHSFFPRSAPKVYAIPNNNFFTFDITRRPQAFLSNGADVEKPASNTNSLVSKMEKLNSENPGNFVPLPIFNHHKKVQLGKLLYKTLDVDVRTPQGPWKKDAVRTVPATVTYQQPRYYDNIYLQNNFLNQPQSSQNVYRLLDQQTKIDNDFYNRLGSSSAPYNSNINTFAVSGNIAQEAIMRALNRLSNK